VRQQPVLMRAGTRSVRPDRPGGPEADPFECRLACTAQKLAATEDRAAAAGELSADALPVGAVTRAKLGEEPGTASGARQAATRPEQISAATPQMACGSESRGCAKHVVGCPAIHFGRVVGEGSAIRSSTSRGARGGQSTTSTSIPLAPGGVESHERSSGPPALCLACDLQSESR
jgi:hypothetical protein